MIKHIEMWKVSDDKKEEMKQQLDRLKTIPKILHIEVGTKINHLNHLTDPYDIILYSEFGSVEALQEFQKHTKYKEVEESVERLGHDREVLDYQAEDSLSVHELIKLEYEETSEDWRHRDSLTWQMPAVLVAVGGLLVANTFNLQESTPPLIKISILGMTMLFAAFLTVAFRQNLNLQKKNSDVINELNRRTERYKFIRWGSGLFFWLSVAITIFLIALFIWTALSFLPIALSNCV
jgi:hypothetical protein